ncbi:MAG: hypothetical protein IPM81_03015 [Saprospirales bacterium]|nr:hypothetical protein [Saprospirales bacterium]
MPAFLSRLSKAVLGLFVVFQLTAQSAGTPLPPPACGADLYFKQLQQRYPEIREKLEREEQLRYAALQKGTPQPDGPAASFLVPVVFHIVHEDGPENLSHSRILAALQQLNDAFAHSGYYAGAGPGADAQIQFCLAQRMPGGAASPGITRTFSALTNLQYGTGDDSALKNLIRWDTREYINIWVIRDISTNVIGYSTLPGAHGLEADGLVVEANYIGQPAAYGGLLAHEMGHYLGLYHTFQGGCSNDDCLLQGDRVCDTPPDQATFTACPFNSCQTDADAPAPNPFTTDQNDPAENFMDYTPFSCMYQFTEGQGARMRYFLSGTRTSLLQSIGCLQACPIPVNAAIIPSATKLLVGDTLVCTAQTENVSQYEWYVDGFLWAQTPAFRAVGLSIGVHQVKLIGRAGTPNCLAADALLVDVACNLQGGILPSATQLTPGNGAVFTAVVSNATQYQWKVNNQPAGSGMNLNFTFPAVGIYLVELLVSNTSCTQTFSQTVAVNAPCTPLAPPQCVLKGFSCLPEAYNCEVFSNGDLMLAGEDCGNSMVIRLAPDGSIRYANKMDLGFEILLRDALPTPDNGLVATSGIKDSFSIIRLFKLDSMGQIDWSKKIPRIGGNFFGYRSLAVQADGSLLLFGLYSIPSPYTYFGLLAQLSPDGAVQWARRIQEPNYYPRMVVARRGGGSYALWIRGSDWDSNPVMRFSETGELLWQKDYLVNSAQQSEPPGALLPEADGGFSLVYLTYVNSNRHLTLVRCDGDGDVRWVKGYRVTTSAFIPSNVHFAIKTADNGYLLTGYSYYTQYNQPSYNSQAFVRLDSLGGVKWASGVLAYDNFGSVSVEPVTRCGADWQGGVVLPIPKEQADEIYLMHTNASGFAGGCADQTASVSVNTTIPATFIPTSLQAMPFDSLIVAPDSFAVLSKPGVFKELECPQYPNCPENCSNSSVDDDRDKYPDCYDPQCACFMAPACTAKSITGNIRARLAWETPVAESLIGAVPMVGNLNPADGPVPEIIVPQAPKTGIAATSKALLFSGDGSNRAQPDRPAVNIPLVNGALVPHLAVADMFRDGRPGIFTTQYNKYVYGHFNFTPGATWPLPKTIAHFSNGPIDPSWRPHVADFDNDGVLEIYTGNAVVGLKKFSATALRLYTYIKADTTLPFGRLSYNNYQYRAANPVAAELLVRAQCSNKSDCDGLELAAGPVIYAIDLSIWDGDYNERQIYRNLNDLDPGPDIWGDGYTAVADINLDNTPDVVVAGRRNDTYGVYAWNANGLLKFFPYPENTPFSGGLPCIANVFDDRQAGFTTDCPEIIAASANRLTCFNVNAATANPGMPWWWSIATADSAGFMGVTAFDFNVDGLSEIVFRDPLELRIVYGGGAPFPAGVDPFSRNWFSMPAPGPVADSYPTVADCDADGQAEIIFTSYGPNGPDSTDALKGRLRVLEADTLAWPGCRPLWNQYGNTGPHIDNDLTVPIHQLEPHRSFTGGKRPFNRYGAQIQDLDTNMDPYIRAADLHVQVDSLWCGSGQLWMKIRVCNTGALALPDSVPVRFYRGNPNASNAPFWATPRYLPAPLPPGGCVQSIIPIPVENGQPYFGMVNDAGVTARPFAPDSFHAAKAWECNYTNNLFQVSWTWNTPALNLGPDQHTCTGNALPLDAGAGFARYRWQDGSSEQFFTASGPGKYWVDAFDECGFIQTDTLVLHPDPAGQINLGPDLTICPGTPLSLNVAGFGSVVWSPAGAVSCATCPSITLTPILPLTLTVTGVLGDCYASDSIRINVGLILNVLTSTTPAHAGQPDGTAVATPLGGTPPFQFLWSTGAKMDSLSGLPPGQYSVIVTDALGCSISSTVIVEQTVSTTTRAEAEATLHALPNPAAQRFRVEITGDIFPGSRLYMTNTLGQRVWENPIADAVRSYWEVDCANWPAGVYQVVLITAFGRKTVQVTVLH